MNHDDLGLLWLLLVIRIVGVIREPAKEDWRYEVASMVRATAESWGIEAEVPADGGQMRVIKAQSRHADVVTKVIRICKRSVAGDDAAVWLKMDHCGGPSSLGARYATGGGDTRNPRRARHTHGGDTSGHGRPE